MGECAPDAPRCHFAAAATKNQSFENNATVMLTSPTMSHSESPPPETHDITFSASLTTYTKADKGKRGKETKKTKTKKFKFSVSDDKYLEYLRECLESQGMEQYQVAAKHRFGFKYVYPMSKPYVISSQL